MRINPIQAHIYVTYLELYEFGMFDRIIVFDRMLSNILGTNLQGYRYQAKHKAKYCEDRKTELLKMYSLTYTDGYLADKGLMRQLQYIRYGRLGAISSDVTINDVIKEVV